MNKIFTRLFIVIIVIINLTSCGSDPYIQRSGSNNTTGNEGGIVGSGNTIDCNKKTNTKKSECNNGIY